MWTAIYEDGTELKQFENREHLFKEIDRDRLKIFRLNDEATTIDLHIRKGIFFVNGAALKFKSGNNRLIYLRRVRCGLGPEAQSEVAYLLGYQFTENGRNNKVVFKLSKSEITVSCE